MDKKSPSMLVPCATAGLVFGALASLPYLRLVNACTCCSFVALCGFVAAMMYSGRAKAAGTEFRPGSGALVGLVAGGFYAISVSLVGAVVTGLFGNPDTIAFFTWMRDLEGVPPESADMIDQALDQMTAESGFSFVGFIFGFFFNVLIGAAVATIGGLIGGAVFKVEPPAPSQPAAPPVAE
jgi:hypothetical protein